MADGATLCTVGLERIARSIAASEPRAKGVLVIVNTEDTILIGRYNMSLNDITIAASAAVYQAYRQSIEDPEPEAYCGA